ncbi:MAG: ABC transporter permease [Chloroflexota bacterium]|nr:ABC transporter permease [Chloroflexota bacterium]
MATIPSSTAGSATPAAPEARIGSMLQRQGALIALVVLTCIGALRYNGFISTYNIVELLRYNAMFGLIALGMTFVIMTGGIDLSVGAVAALASVIAALLSPYGATVAVEAAVGTGLLIGLFNGWVITRFNIAPFITTLAMLLGARGAALLLAKNAAVSVDTAGGYVAIGLNGVLGIPFPVIMLLVAYVLGSIVLNYTRFGRHVLAIGGNEDAARLMGLPVDRIKLGVYALSGGLAALAGAILAALTYTGIPTEGLGWELTAIAAVVVGGTLLTGGIGSVGTTFVGVLLLGLIINMLSFENLSAYWQSVIRGVFLLLVVVLQNQLSGKRKAAA